MILMSEAKQNNQFANKEYKKLSFCINELNKLYDVDFNNFEPSLIHDALHACKWIKSKQVPYTTKDGDTKKSTLYYIGSLRKLTNPNNVWDDEYDKDFAELTNNLEKNLKIELSQPVQPKPTDTATQDTEAEEPAYDETNMDYCNQELLDKYQFENKRTIKITEAQLSRLKSLLEGVKWSNQDGKLNLKINSLSTDKDNMRDTGYVDTRLFGKPSDILDSDGTYGHADGLKNLYKDSSVKHGVYRLMLQCYKNDWPDSFLISYTKDVYGFDIPQSMMDKYKNHIEDGTVEEWLSQAIARTGTVNSMRGERYRRVKSAMDNNEEKTERYISSTVPGTNVKYIALFFMTDFNFSDAIKHGSARVSPLTNKVNIPSVVDPTDSRKTLPVKVTYDDGITPDIENNFSLPAQSADHYKKQYTDKNGYTSVTQFMDKSVMYAAHVLKKVGFIPDYIVTAPSSSDFNTYYATNLSNKLNVPYIQNFFKRNLINVVFDDKTTENMKNAGFSEKDVLKFKGQIENVAFTEISNIVFQPITEMTKKYKMDSSLSLDFKKTAWDTIVKILTEENKPVIVRKLCAKFLARNQENKTNNSEAIEYHINTTIGKRQWNSILQQVYASALKYCDILETSGYKISFNNRFKITKFEKRFRPFLNNVYVVADSELTDGKFQQRYQNAKFLIFDEDINSGTTLRLLIDALQDNTLDTPSSNILCLVNGYSNSGF